MPVQQHVLNWLYSVLTSEYHDVNRTYHDVAQALTHYPTISPRTDVHTFPNGSSALLLHLTGTIPVNFRGNTYRFPVSIWIPHAYPREPPFAYVTPTETMMVRPGQHVDPQGQIYHPYLVGWAQFWDKSNIQDFMSVLADIFAKEPPVVSRQTARQPMQRPSNQTRPPPPLPPLPPKTASHPADPGQNPSAQSHPPPPPSPPPKEHQPRQPSHVATSSSSSTKTARASGSSRYDSAPPLPPQNRTSSPGGRSGQPQFAAHDQFGQFASTHSPASHTMAPPGPHGMSSQNPGASPPQSGASQHATQWLHQGQSPPGYGAQGQRMQAQMYQQQQGQMAGAAAPPPNILDEPLTLEIPANTAVAPPAIPPNPEKDNLLRQLAQTLYKIRQRTLQQNASSMAGLQAQRQAMQQALAGIQSESSQLTQLSNVLHSNTIILREALRKADGVIEGSTSHPVPDIDELLVGPNVVSNQLYNSVAEERALGDAIFMLGRAVERGRISTTVFAKTTRSMAREWYLKKALVRKIGRGMGMQ